MRVLRQALNAARFEVAMVRRFPHLWWLVFGIVWIPALYAFIHLESVWDPASRTSALPALIVNQDQGAQSGGLPVNIGTELTRNLREKAVFGYREVSDPAAARESVRRGESLFALVIPPDFSASAISAQAPGAGRLVVFASEGNNYVGAGFAKRFAAELGHQVNETLAARRWSMVLGATASSSDSLYRLREGATRLRQGAGALDDGLSRAHVGSVQSADGAARLAGHVGGLADGVRQLGAGVRTLDAKRPNPSDLQAFKSGAAQLAAGHTQWQQATAPLQDGVRTLRDGVLTLGDEAQAIPFYGAQLAAATTQLGQGAAQLQAGLRSASEAQAKLGAGAQSLATGAAQVADGFGTYASGVSTLAARLPPDAALDDLAAGSSQLVQVNSQVRDGLMQLKSASSQLAAGLGVLAQSLPDDIGRLSGTPEGLAMSVQPRVEIDAPVQQEGLGFAPIFIPVALWLGATMAAFLFPLRQVSRGVQGSMSASLVLGKMSVLGSINAAQALAVLAMAWLLLGMKPVHVAAWP